MIRTGRFAPALAVALALAAPARSGPPRALASVPFRIHDNRILVEVRLEGQGPFTMIFDTGGGNIMTPECRRRLGLASAGTESTSGAGEKRIDAGITRVARMQVGALVMRDQDFRIVDLGEIRRACRFPRLDGVVGRELLERAHASVDFDRGVLRLTEPSGDSATRPVDAVSIELADGMPVVDGHIEGVPARMIIDTGDRSNLTLFRSFAASSGLDTLFAGGAEIPTGIGIGGPIPGRVATLSSVEFGPLHERGIVARLPSTRAGGFATNPLAGSIGLGLLRNYNLEIDYRNRYIALRRRKAPYSRSEFVPLAP